MAEVIEAHIAWLADESRIDALRRAITQVVSPGDIVIDLGCGTGVLSMMACAAGAARVYAIEEDPIIELARKVARANGFHDRIHFVHANSRAAQLPERADVLVSDLLGPFSIEVGFWEAYADAAARLLKPGATCIPSAVNLFLAPIESPSLRGRLEFVENRPAGFDMSALAAHARNTVYPAFPLADDLLAPATQVGHYPVLCHEVPIIAAEFTVTAKRTGVVDAVAGWFDAELCAGVHMTNAPTAAGRLDRQAVVLPVWPPLMVEEFDPLSVSLRLLISDRIFRWTVTRCRQGAPEEQREGCNLKGIFIAREDLARVRRDQQG